MRDKILRIIRTEFLIAEIIRTHHRGQAIRLIIQLWINSANTNGGWVLGRDCWLQETQW